LKSGDFQVWSRNLENLRINCLTYPNIVKGGSYGNVFTALPNTPGLIFRWILSDT
jgi:hypothetical protein